MGRPHDLQITAYTTQTPFASLIIDTHWIMQMTE